MLAVQYPLTHSYIELGPAQFCAYMPAALMLLMLTSVAVLPTRDSLPSILSSHPRHPILVLSMCETALVPAALLLRGLKHCHLEYLEPGIEACISCISWYESGRNQRGWRKHMKPDANWPSSLLTEVRSRALFPLPTCLPSISMF